MLDNPLLPQWPTEVPGVCVGMEERVGACCGPQHYGSSGLTGSQTKWGKRQQDFRSESAQSEVTQKVFPRLLFTMLYLHLN